MAQIEMDIWERTPENPRILKYVGQRAAQEVFEELKYRLESTGYLPDEYFSMDSQWKNGREIPKDADIFCTTDFGGSEGIYTAENGDMLTNKLVYIASPYAGNIEQNIEFTCAA